MLTGFFTLRSGEVDKNVRVKPEPVQSWHSTVRLVSVHLSGDRIHVLRVFLKTVHPSCSPVAVGGAAFGLSR